MYQCIVCILVPLLEQCIFQCMVIDALYEKKQAIMTYENEIAKLQAQGENLETTSTEKETCFDKYETIVKESEGEMI